MKRWLGLLCLLALAPRARAQEFVLAPVWISGGAGSGIGEYGVPESVAIDSLGRVAVTDKGRMRLHVYARDTGQPLFDVGSQGTALGQFDRPNGIAVDRDGRILVVEQLNHRVQVLAPDYSVIGAFGSQGTAPGTFQKPMGIALDSQNRIYVTDESREDTQVFDAAGNYLWKFDTLPRLHKVESIEVHEPSGRIFVCDEGLSRVNIYDLQGHFQGSFGEQGSGPGQFGNDTNAVRLDGRGRIYVNDQGGGRINVYAPDTRFIGAFRCAGKDMSSADGMALSEADNLILVADQGNDRILAWDLGEIQCRLALFELASPAPPLGAPAASLDGLALGPDSAPVPSATTIDFAALAIAPGDPARVERSVLHVRSNRDRRGICVPLVETGPATDRFTARLLLSGTSDEATARLAAGATDIVRAHVAGDAAETRFDVSGTAPTPIDLRLDDREPGRPVLGDAPLLTWRLDDPRRKQTAFEMRLVRPDGGVVWQSGTVARSICAWNYGGPLLPPAIRFRLELRVSAGEAWSSWTGIPLQRAGRPAAAASTTPPTLSATPTWPVPLGVRLAMTRDGDPALSRLELWLPDGSRRKSPLLQMVGDSLQWTPPAEIVLPENGTLRWRLLTTEHRDTYESPWWILYRNGVEETPSAPQVLSPADGVVVTGPMVTLAWQPGVDPDPGTVLRHEVEWSLAPTFTSPSTVLAPGGASLAWSEPLADGILFWRVRATDSTGRTSRSAPRQLQFRRTLSLVLRLSDASGGSSSALVGARAGAADGFVAGEDQPSPVTASLPKCSSLLGTASTPLAVDWRALRQLGSQGWTWRLRLRGAPNATLTLAAQSLQLPTGCQARLTTTDGRPLAAFVSVGDRAACRMSAAGEAIVVLSVRAPGRLDDPGRSMTAATTRAQDPAAPGRALAAPLRLGSRLQLAPPGTAGVAFELYDVRGRRVRSGHTDPDGGWVWDGRDAGGARLASGVYLLRVDLVGAPAGHHKLIWSAR